LLEILLRIAVLNSEIQPDSVDELGSVSKTGWMERQELISEDLWILMASVEFDYMPTKHTYLEMWAYELIIHLIS
jgi:hypothetical protein